MEASWATLLASGCLVNRGHNAGADHIDMLPPQQQPLQVGVKEETREKKEVKREVIDIDN